MKSYSPPPVFLKNYPLTIKAIFVISVLFCSERLQSQLLSGYPPSSISAVTYSVGTTHYTDDVRAAVVSINGTNDQISLSGSYTYGTFSSGDHILIMQMRNTAGTAGGEYEEAIINTVGTNLLTLTSPLNRTYYLTGSDFRVQVIKIERYYNLSLFGGKMQCRAWDGNTGGVVCFEVGGTMKIHKGIVSAAKSGFIPEGITWGAGGTGGSGDASYSNAGGGSDASSLNNSPCITPTPTSGNEVYGNIGDDGESVPGGSLGGSGSATSGTILNYGKSDRGIPILRMGSAGYYTTGQIAGDGGSGGGHGGTGGSTNGTVPAPAGLSGDVGDDAEGGGDVGHGAQGGGIVLVKVYQFDLRDPNNALVCIYTAPNPWKIFYADGANGEVGKPGGKGGSGGLGGEGGEGIQVGSVLYYSGGNGGAGENGIGSNGGDGSDGGESGYVYIYTNQNPIPNATNILYNTIVVGPGKKGWGGPGGYTKQTIDNATTKHFTLSSPYSYCGSGVADEDYCDCDEAFRSFINYTPSDYSYVSGTQTHKFENIPYKTEYTKTNQHLVYTYTPGGGGPVQRYHCWLYGSVECNDIFGQITYVDHNSFFDHITLPATIVGTGSGQTVDFTDDASTSRISAQWKVSEQRITDLSDPGQQKCYAGTCNPNDPGNPSHASRGDAGANGTEGGAIISDPNDDESNWYVELGTNEPPPGSLNSGGNFDVFMDNGGNISVNSFVNQNNIETYSISITDVSGKECYAYNGLKPDESVNVKHLNSGIYYLKMYNKYSQKTKMIVVQTQ